MNDNHLRDPKTGDYWQCQSCRQYLDADGTCPEGCPPALERLRAAQAKKLEIENTNKGT